MVYVSKIFLILYIIFSVIAVERGAGSLEIYERDRMGIEFCFSTCYKENGGTASDDDFPCCEYNCLYVDSAQGLSYV